MAEELNEIRRKTAELEEQGRETIASTNRILSAVDEYNIWTALGAAGLAEPGRSVLAKKYSQPNSTGGKSDALADYEKNRSHWDYYGAQGKLRWIKHTLFGR